MSKPLGGRRAAVISGQIGEKASILDEEVFEQSGIPGDPDDYDYLKKEEFTQYLKEKGLSIPPGGPITIEGEEGEEIASSKKIADEILIDEENGIIYICENKRQEGSGSVLEKLETGEYKYNYWSRIAESIGMELGGYYFTLMGSYFERTEVRERLADIVDYYAESDDNIKIIFVVSQN